MLRKKLLPPLRRGYVVRVSKALWHGDAWPLTCCSEAQDGAFLAAQRDGKVVPPHRWAPQKSFWFRDNKRRETEGSRICDTCRYFFVRGYSESKDIGISIENLHDS